jgi:MFS family permease
MANDGLPLASMLRSLAHRNFRLFFVGQGLSLIGTFMQTTAMLWLVNRLTRDEGGTGSAFWLGLIAFVSQVPGLVLAPVAGVFADRHRRRPILYVTQSLALLQAAALTALSFSNAIQIWHLLVLGALLGVVTTFDATTRQAFLSEMVGGKEDLSNAIALNSSLFNGASLVGPFLAGVVVWVGGAWGEGVCFLLNALSYLAVLVALFAMRVKDAPRPAAARGWRSLAEGAAYTFGFPPIRAILLLVAVVSFVGRPYQSLTPLFADRLSAGVPSLAPLVLGLLTAASGVGALGGALYMAARKTVLGLGARIAQGAAAFGVALALFAFSPWLALSLPALAVMGFAVMVQFAASNTILQTIAEDDKRGRVLSFYAMAFLGVAPLGSLALGGLAEAAGAPLAVGLGGVVCLAAAGLFAWQLPRLRAHVRPIYRKIGILPEVAEGIRSASEMPASPAVVEEDRALAGQEQPG